ncbi:hypothetical protein LAZ67_12002444 [Cordylochernes scorpioides]|uniref:Uncharacterized protein n=1 Tax=Cordylochernes scorpioides TaxID=51811 RepID=A0ABY6L4I7_9ARAC|nr:hypothetical protein LAZ67_12002444 [Cordylochernes scorpioides]
MLEPIQPYNFEFNIPVGDHNGFGQISRQESKDESGRVVGSYTINDPDGRQRIVNYIADESGYHASIQTNEPGTKSESPADANIVSSARFVILAVLFAVAASQFQDQEPIQPYNFEYNIPVGDHNGFGHISRQESKDESGRVVGSYTINDPDGRQRIVNYIADESGFRASIQTNEPGTKSESPADANIVSNAVDSFAAILANGQRGRLA